MQNIYGKPVTVMGPIPADMQFPVREAENKGDWQQSRTRPSKCRGILCKEKKTMAVANLAEVISALTPEEQESVRLFVESLKRKGSDRSEAFLTAADEFVEQHLELLRRLAQ